MALVSARRKCLAQKQFDWECDLYRVKESLSTVPANHKLLPQGTKGRNVCSRALKRRCIFLQIHVWFYFALYRTSDSQTAAVVEVCDHVLRWADSGTEIGRRKHGNPDFLCWNMHYRSASMMSNSCLRISGLMFLSHYFPIKFLFVKSFKICNRLCSRN